MEKLAREISERDERDSRREASPLRRAKDAVLLDTTDLSFQQVVDRIVELAEKKKADS